LAPGTWDDPFVNAIARPDLGEPSEVRFGNGNRAVLREQRGAGPRELLAALDLESGGRGSAVILVCGGADDLKDASLVRAVAMLGPAVSSAAEVAGAAVLDGGTSSGVMEVTGAARAKRPRAMPVLVGVAPAGLVTYPGGPEGDRVPLEQNHSHFVLADSDEWGGETGLLMAVAAARAGNGRVAVVLAGGGEVAKAEVVESVRRGWPVFVIQGTGGLADSILELCRTHRTPHRRPAARLLPGLLEDRMPPPPSSIADADLREIVSGGDIRAVTGAEPGQFARRIAWELQDEPALKSAWQQFATYDHLATRLRATFTRLQAWILLLGVVATLLALIYAQVGGQALHWAVVAIPILAAVLIAVAGRRAVGQRWVMLRAAAEAIKAEIYRYRALAAVDASRLAGGEHASRQQELAAHLDAIDTRLMQTQASSGPLTPYNGPLPPEMYGAGRDDDGLSPLDAERYLQIRVADQLAYYHGRVRSLDRGRNALQLLAIAAGATGAILAAAGLEVWIGLTSGASAAALAYLGYLQIDNTVVTYNQAAAKLAGLEREWRARSPAQRNSAALRDLVTRGEAALTTELAGWVQQMSDTLEDLKNRQAEAADRVQPAGAARPVPNAASADPSVNTPQGSSRPDSS
jgi:hypothetical protein